MAALRIAANLGVWLLAAAVSAASTGAARTRPAARTLEPVIVPARGGQCVADPAVMRINHMNYLKHERNETVHQGIRDPRTSLQACVACHASTQTGSVAVAKTDFCVSCHSYAGVKVDCFECHASKPQASGFVPLYHPHAANAATRLTEQWRTVAAQGVTAP